MSSFTDSFQTRIEKDFFYMFDMYKMHLKDKLQVIKKIYKASASFTQENFLKLLETNKFLYLYFFNFIFFYEKKIAKFSLKNAEQLNLQEIIIELQNILKIMNDALDILKYLLDYENQEEIKKLYNILLVSKLYESRVPYINFLSSFVQEKITKSNGVLGVLILNISFTFFLILNNMENFKNTELLIENNNSIASMFSIYKNLNHILNSFIF
jgi:hypothetical protein